MKRLLILFLLLLSVNAFAFEDSSPMRIVASGSVTQANMRLSGVDGTAFVDFGAANVLTTKIGHQLKITDSAGKSIIGYIKAAGSGETLGDTLNVSNCVNNTFATFDGESPSGFHAISNNSAQSGGTADEIALGQYSLYKTVYDAVLTTGTSSASIRVSLGTSLTTYASSSVSGSNSFYTTWPTASTTGVVHFRNISTIAEFTISSLVIKQVLTPSATGVTIVSSKGGATYNWFNKNSAFNWNDTSGYTYQIIKESTAVLVDSDTCTNANATINLTDGSAAWSCTGIDDSAYQDGKHICSVSDSAGRVVWGYYKASGSGAIVNAKSGSTQNWLGKHASFATDGDYVRKIYYVGD